MNESLFGDPSKVESVHEVLLSLNLGFSVSYSLLTYSVAPLSAGTAFAAKVVREINGLLNVRAYRGLGLQIAFIALACVTAPFFLMALRLLRRTSTSFRQLALGPVAGFAVLSTAPVLWVVALRAGGPYIFWWDEYPTWPVGSPWLSMGLEVLLVYVLIYALRRLRLPYWCVALPLMLHFCYWGRYMWPAMSHGFSFSAPRLLFWVWPCSGLAWLRYMYLRTDAVTAFRRPNGATETC